MFRKIILTAAVLLAGSAYAEDRDIAISDLPKTVVDAATKAYPKAKILRAEEEVGANAKYFELKVQDGNTQRKLYIQPDGTIFKNKIND